MSERRAALERLCERLGVATAYHDIWGHRHAAPDDSLRAFLRAFGVAADSDEAIAAASLAADEEASRPGLPPAAALPADDAGWSRELCLPAGMRSVRWRIETEDGQHLEGTADVGGDVVAPTRRRLGAGVALPAGYHRLHVAGLAGSTLLIAAPPRCWEPPVLQQGGRLWGPTVQLYGVRSEDNWGIGDFGDLGRIVEQWGGRGAGLVGLNPLHALFAHNPAHISPYSPSSRLRLNTLYIDVEAVDDMRDCEAAQVLVRSASFQARLEALRDSEQVDYPGVSAAKHEVLALLYDHFRAHHLARDTARARAFRAYQAGSGPDLRGHALFEALQARFHAENHDVWGWPVWPADWRDPACDLVQQWAREHEDRVEYHEYLQWLAETQLERVQAHCRTRGLAAGLYLDLAVSVDRAGSDTWSHQGVYALDASVGAPPDEFNRQGQAWGLPPLRPDRLRAGGYGIFIDTLRAGMRHAGALRIDHVMGLMRLFWIPPGQTARDGGYVHYRADELLAIVALESQRHRCLVIGEDLGTVPPEIRQELASRGVLSYRLLYFERDGERFRTPHEYPRDALVAVSTHDLPTLAGWWSGRDIDWRHDLGLIPDDAAVQSQRDARRHERQALLAALGQAADTDEPPAEAAHLHAAATPCKVMVLQLEDALGVIEQPNLPGTVNEHPNWRRKLPVDLDTMLEDPRVQHLAGLLARERPHAPLSPPSAAQLAIVPRATYRLQLHAGFTFDDARCVLPYLSSLGVSHVYCSPITRARAGSLHGYDVASHDEISPELGGRAGFERLCAALREHHLGLVLDLVPNHMGVGSDNDWWNDVLENGRASLYAQHFDIDWEPLDEALRGKVLLPVFGSPYGDVLDRRELAVEFDPASGSFDVHYFEHTFPLDVRGYGALLARVRTADAGLDESLAALATGFTALPGRDDPSPQVAGSRAAGKEALKRRLAALAAEHLALAPVIAAALAPLHEPDALHELLEAQAWRLAYWRVAPDEINYRRFFDINTLAALRMERKAVFEATQSLPLELAARGEADGLRIDHPDGLRDPAQYFLRLQRGVARRRGHWLPEAPVQSGQRPARAVYLIAEKIAASHENVPETWAVHGTTGYRWGALLNGLFVDADNEARFDRVWREFTQDDARFDEHAYAAKRQVVRDALASELTVLASELLRIARAHRGTRDHTFNSLRQALAEVVACMPVYRTYIVQSPSPQDQRYIDWAVAQARRHAPTMDASIFDFVRACLLGQPAPGAGPPLNERVLRWAARFQQFSAPVAAKGVEDTAFYRYLRLASLNEVGGDPDRFGVTVRAFHGASADRCARWANTMLATSTHDHKRSEDVRLRIDVLSERPAAWRGMLRRWSRLNRMHRIVLDDGRTAPSAVDEYLLYQTLIGTLPAEGLTEDTLPSYRDRIRDYLLKAAREAKSRTSWTRPDVAYETALSGFVDGAFARAQPSLFVDDLTRHVQALSPFAALSCISAALLKFSSPGVPDIYQGHEAMALTLVDPDNRRPVDFHLLQSALEELLRLSPGESPALLKTLHDGRARLWVIQRLLDLRRREATLFRDGDYRALDTSGAHADHVVAFVRRHEARAMIAVAGRLYVKLLGDARLPLGEAAWADTAVAVDLPDGTVLTDVLTGQTLKVSDGRLRMAELFARFPGAVLWLGD